MDSIEQTISDILKTQRENTNLDIRNNIHKEIEKCDFRSPMSEYDKGIHEGLMLALKVCGESEGSYKVVL